MDKVVSFIMFVLFVYVIVRAFQGFCIIMSGLKSFVTKQQEESNILWEETKQSIMKENKS